MPQSSMRLYIAVLEDFPDFMTPALVAHSVLGAHQHFYLHPLYKEWLAFSFKKCVVRVNQKEFSKITVLPTFPNTYLGHENNTLDGIKSCAIPLPCYNDQLPKVLKFAKLWKPV